MDSVTPTLEIEPYYSASELAKLLDPSGERITARSITTEREKGRLVGSQVAGKWLYRKSDVLTFLEHARQCPAPQQHQNSRPSSNQAAPPSGPSSTETAVALDAGQRGYLSPELTKSVAPPRPSSNGKKTARVKPARFKAQVIPLPSR
jgi:hypothetical protein